MKQLLVIVSAALALGALPAAADNGQVFDGAAQNRAFGPSLALDAPRQCFNGKAISGVSRLGARTLYVQSDRGAIYNLRLANRCDALDGAEALVVKAGQHDVVCTSGSAEVVVRTAAGSRRCAVADVSAVTRREVATLSAAR